MTNPSCIPGSDGTIDLIVTGGTSPYTYSWGGAIITEDRSGLIAGTYNVTVTDSKGCSVTGTAILTNSISPTVTLLGTNPSCAPGSDGTVDLVVSGGTFPYTYLWSDASITEDLSGLVAGTYDVTVTDAKGCLSLIHI